MANGGPIQGERSSFFGKKPPVFGNGEVFSAWLRRVLSRAERFLSRQSWFFDLNARVFDNPLPLEGEFRAWLLFTAPDEASIGGLCGESRLLGGFDACHGLGDALRRGLGTLRRLQIVRVHDGGAVDLLLRNDLLRAFPGHHAPLASDPLEELAPGPQSRDGVGPESCGELEDVRARVWHALPSFGLPAVFAEMVVSLGVRAQILNHVVPGADSRVLAD